MNVRNEVAEGRAVRVRPLAREINVPPSTLYGQIAKGQIKAIPIGRVLTIPPDEGRRLLGMKAA